MQCMYVAAARMEVGPPTDCRGWLACTQCMMHVATEEMGLSSIRCGFQADNFLGFFLRLENAPGPPKMG